MKVQVTENWFAVRSDMSSHSQPFEGRFDFETEAEAGGQLVRCLTGELELFGHAGEWVIPPDHMVYIPPGRMFRLRARVLSTGLVAKFCHEEVSWHHDGCWVGPVGDFAATLLQHSLRWGPDTGTRDRKARSFYVTLGDMVPEWFRHERILWTPYAENSNLQKVIDFATRRGPSVTLPEAAQFAGMSERTLRRHMQVELGQTWRDFVRELRMNRAMELLRKERLSVTQTAFEVGFSSSSAFSSAFFQYVGKTPSNYARSFPSGGQARPPADRSTRATLQEVRHHPDSDVPPKIGGMH